MTDRSRSDREIYDRYADELLRFASALVGPSGAEDVVADAVVTALGSPGWREVRNHRAYLHRAVLNRAHSVHRSTQRRLAREARTARRDDFEPPAVRAEVLAAMRRLTVRQRAVVFLTYWADLAPSTIADELRITTRTVQRDLAAAHRSLEVLLG